MITVGQVGVTLGFTFLIWYLYIVIQFARKCYLLRSFPGPLALPLIGNLYDVSAILFLKYLSKLRKKYGMYFTYFVGTRSILVICDPLAVRRVLTDSKIFQKGRDYTRTFSLAFGQGLVTSNGEKHKNDKAVLAKYFIRSSISREMPRINTTAKNSMSELITPQLDAQGRTPSGIDIEEFFAILSFRVFIQFSMNAPLASLAQEKECTKRVSAGSLAIGKLILTSPPEWLWRFLPWVQEVHDHTKWIEDVWLRKTIAERRALVKASEGAEGQDESIDQKVFDDCLTAMIKAEVSTEEIIDHVITLASAGHDTTAYFVSYFSLMLAKHPEVQEKVQDEIKRVMGDREEVTADDVTELKYMHMAMQETLRMYAIIPLVTRTSTEDVYIKEANVTIPKNADVMIPLYLINRDPDLWENPNVFNPERFEGRGDTYTSARDGFFPFGYGVRTCIGNTLAQLESCVFMVHLLREFTIKPEPGFKLQISGGISLTSSNSIRVILEKL
jgi:cytochrome P450